VSSSVIVEADGGARGNPGPAGYGAVVLDADSGAMLAERKAAIGVTTNNVAEYQGLIAGLAAARDVGATTVAVRMDSKLVVEQMSGRWQIRHPALQALAATASALAAGFGGVTYEWIPRERNQHADRLANEAMDGAEDSSTGPAHQTGPPAAWTGATGTPTRMLLVRHGQTALSAARRYSGRGNPPLTELGLAQASAIADRLAATADIAAVLTSPLGRARQTADAISKATNAPVTELADLTETDFGAWEGMTFAEAAARDPEAHRAWLTDPSRPAPGGESFDAVHHRVARAAERIAADHGGSTVVVVSHVTPIKTLLRIALAAGPSVLFRLHLDLASLSMVEFYPDGNASVRLVNDVSHLPS
jgi:probable phosphoglycerate mutase